MRRLSMILILALAALVWPATSRAAHAGTAAAAVGSLQTDFNNDGVVDLAVGAPFEDIGSIQDAGAVNVVYGSAGGLSGAGDQQFWQGAGGVAGTAEVGDEFGNALSAGDFNQDGSADLAVGVPVEDIGSIEAAGAVNVLYGSASGLSGAGSQLFRQGAGGVAGTAEPRDEFGKTLVGSDQPTGSAASASRSQSQDVGRDSVPGR